MKIIPGNIHDYYDGCINQLGFSTEGNIFHRTNETINLQIKVNVISYYPYKAEVSEKNNNPLVVIFENNQTGETTGFTKNHIFKFQHFSILFCGKIYNGIRCDFIKNEKIDKQEFFYNCEDLFKFFSKYEIILREKAERFRYGSVTKGYSPNSKPWYEKYFTIKDISEIARANKWVIANTTILENGMSKIGFGPVILNGELKKFHFYKVFDAYSAYQELSMWVDNLAYPGNVMIDIEDEYRIAAHGFDHKYAFRKEPSKKK